MLYIGICDDQTADRDALKKAILQIPGCRRDKDLKIFEYISGEQMLFEVAEGQVDLDLLFLDIYMTGINGMEAAKALRAKGNHTPLIFLTTSPDFALESYDVDAFGYLLKPIDAEKLNALMDKLEILQRAEKYYIYRRGARSRRISYSEIIFVESSDHKILIHLEDGSILESTGKMDEMQEALDSECFLRCHQSYLVNMNHIVQVDEDFLMDSGDTVSIRKKERRTICDTYYKWMLKEAF